MSIGLSRAASPPAGSIPLLLPLFFVSGFPALIYQLVWQRALFAVYGVNIEAVTVIVSGFLLGLGLGSLAGGRLSSIRGVSLLGAFGAIELCLAAIGFVSLDALDLFSQHAAAWPAWASTVAVLALLVVPTTLMGATLPILVAYLVRRSANVGRSVGLLYFVNTLGSSVACFAAGMWLMRTFGMRGSANAAAVLNLVVGIGALAGAAAEARRRGAEAHGASVEADGAPRRGVAPAPGTRMSAAVLLAALTGYLALSYEMLWFRAFSLAAGTASAFAMVLGSYLAGVALGSFRGRELCGQTVDAPSIIRALALSLALAAALGFALLPLASHAGAFASPALIPAMLLLVMLHTAVIGLAFPLISHLGVPPDARAGVGVSTIYLANIAGAVAGTLVTGFVVMDHWGLPQTTALLTGLALVLAAALAPWAGAGRRPAALAAAEAATLVAALPFAAEPAFAGLFERLVFKGAVSEKPPFTATVENKSGVINVTADGYVFGGGFYDGRISVSLLNDVNGLVRPAMLSFFHPAPAEVLMIGLATGAWAQVVAANPHVQRLTIIEINRGYRDLIAGHDAVRSLLQNPKVEIVFDDARRWLRRNPGRRFDAVVQNTTWHFRSNVTNLLSAEYLDSVARHLRPGGIMMYNTTGSARAQRTACVRFPEAVRYANMMVVGAGVLATDPDRLDGALRGHRVDGQSLLPADEAGDRRREEVLASAAMPHLTLQDASARSETCASILKRTEGMPIITDDNMGEEW
ncbi:MAG: Spermidine synthase long [uncultured Acetobacteraceae bacterium]|uniref:Spermidine synthase long n=1 Tax=uncultured Acetobacteraceae bacterium TaxID=169975 RepID=A0A6J4HTY7_9PROT|nr:MAG: Spermidine synthase long [uncultured Acetobacteraceae bacterium]